MEIFRLSLLFMLLRYILIYCVCINRSALYKTQNFCHYLELEFPCMEFEFKHFFGNFLTLILYTKMYSRVL